jgi:polygalacturonase
MRIIAFAVAAVVSGPAAAQSWQEYSYSEYAFSVTFPASPKIETTTYEVADGRSVPARIYSARQDKSQFKMTVADLANTGLDERAVIDHAIKTLSQGATVRVNVPARIYQV